jgi:hypothetical protein
MVGISPKSRIGQAFIGAAIVICGAFVAYHRYDCGLPSKEQNVLQNRHHPDLLMTITTIKTPYKDWLGRCYVNVRIERNSIPPTAENAGHLVTVEVWRTKPEPPQRVQSRD